MIIFRRILRVNLIKYKKKQIISVCLGLVALIFLAACQNTNSKENEKNASSKLSVVTTFYPVYEFTKNVVGEAGEVSLLVPAGTEPHDYEPSAKDMLKINQSDLFVYHNDNMETWVGKLKNTLGEKSPKIIEGTREIVLLPGSDDEQEHSENESDHHHEYDPHTWLSPKMAIKEVKTIEAQLKKLYPKQANLFSENAEKYVKKLSKLDQKYSEELKEVKQKNFVTQHAAFRYLALDYGLNQVSIAGLNPDKEPSAKRLGELKKYVEANSIQYIYFEKNANDKFAKTLAKEAKVNVEVLNPLESLTKKELSEGGNYIKVMEQNLIALKKTTDTEGKDIQAEEKSKEGKTVANGYFSDGDVKNRSLSDYSGNWQSVYPLLENGTLDQVFELKSKINKDMSAADYKDYYTKGYKTDVDQILIDDKTMSFVKNGVKERYTYQYKGFKILNYSKGNRGVRYLFESNDPKAGEFKYVQFSDHNISPVKTSHFHIFHGGESQEKVLSELENWPTYYPKKLTGFEIAQEIIAH